MSKLNFVLSVGGRDYELTHEQLKAYIRTLAIPPSARVIAAAGPGRFACLPAAKAGSGGQGSTSRVAREVPPEAASAEVLIARWKREPALHAEFGSLARFAAYERASAQGRAHICHPQANRVQKPQQLDRRWSGF